MSQTKPIQRIAIVGTGVIGASWAAYYLSRGFDVVATDPAPNAETGLRKYVDNAWTLLSKFGLAPGASTNRLTFTPKLREALVDADLVQENGPKRSPFKAHIFDEQSAVWAVNSQPVTSWAR